MEAGLAVGLTYGAVECVFVAVLPKLAHTGFSPLSVAAHAGVIAAYGLAGALVAAAVKSGPLRRVDGRTLAPTATAAFLLAIATCVGLGTEFSLRAAYAIAVALGLAAGALLAPARAAFGPLPAFAFALAVPWVGFAGLAAASRSVRTTGTVLVPLVLWIALSALVARLPHRSGVRWATGLAALAILLGMAEQLQDRPPLRAPAAAAAPAAGLRSVVLISLDTVRADHLSVYGYARETSPELARFAAGATRFSHCTSSSDMTLPSHASLFTGLYAIDHGAHYAPPASPYGRPLESRFTTLAERLAAVGYRTIGIVANPAYLDRSYGLSQGFEVWDDQSPRPWVHKPAPYFLRATLMRGVSALLPQAWREHWYRRGDEIRAATLSELGGLPHDGRPLFLFVNFMDAHWPYLAPASFRGRFGPHPNEIDSNDAYRALDLQLTRLEKPITPEQQAELTARYDESLASLDSEVGLLLDALRERHLFEGALVIVTADHGESFGQRSLLEHAVSVHSDQIEVPLLIKWPGQREGRVDDRRASGVDVLPTILDALGLDLPVGLPGLSLLRPDVERRVYAESYPNGKRAGWHPRFRRTERAVLEGRFKLIHSTQAPPQLYDVAADPAELRDLAATEPERVAALEAALASWTAASDRSSSTAQPVPLDPETRSQLESLGYVPGTRAR